MRWTPERIRERRDELGLTQEQLAERVGASLRTVWGWEDGAMPQKKWTTALNEVLGEKQPVAVDWEQVTDEELLEQLALRLERNRGGGGRPPRRKPATYDPKTTPRMPGSAPHVRGRQQPSA